MPRSSAGTIASPKQQRASEDLEHRQRRKRRRSRVRRRRAIGFVLAVIAVVIVRFAVFAPANKNSNFTVLHEGSSTFLVPKYHSLSPLRSRIVSIAESQIGYTTDPSTTYCNKYSAFWQSGTSDCGNANLDEQWCADFAAWVWNKAGADVTYAYVNGDLNSSSASFYEWGEARGTWHPVGSGYQPLPGDVAVYGLDTTTLIADHVAVVIGYQPGDRGPIAVNGDGDQTGFSVAEVKSNEYDADIKTRGAPLSGYVSPN